MNFNNPNLFLTGLFVFFFYSAYSQDLEIKTFQPIKYIVILKKAMLYL